MPTPLLNPCVRSAWLAVGASVVVSVTACGGGAGGSGEGVSAAPPASAPGPGAPPPPAPPAAPAPPSMPTAYAYVARESADAIGVYAFDSASATLSASSTLSLAAGSAPRHTAYDAVHRRLYIANHGTDRIEVAESDATTGMLSAPALASTLADPTWLAIDPQGRFLYAAFGGSNCSLCGVMAFRINPSDGQLLYVNFLTTSREPTALVVEPHSRYAFMATSWGVLTPYTIDASTGALTAGIVTPMGMSSLVFDASGSRLYAANDLATYTHLFDVQADGSFSMRQMMSMSGMPPKGLAMDPAGSYLYSIDTFHRTVQTLRIRASDGQLSAESTLTLAAGCTPKSVAVSPDGGSVHVACDGSSGALLGHAVNRSTGALAPVAASPTNVGGRAMTFVPVP